MFDTRYDFKCWQTRISTNRSEPYLVGFLLHGVVCVECACVPTYVYVVHLPHRPHIYMSGPDSSDHVVEFAEIYRQNLSAVIVTYCYGYAKHTHPVTYPISTSILIWTFCKITQYVVRDHLIVEHKHQIYIRTLKTQEARNCQYH